MLLTLWIVLTIFGFAVFVLGHLLGFPGIAAIGAVLVMLTGAQVVAEDIQLPSGEVTERSYTEIGNETVENRTVVNSSYETHSWTQAFASDHAIGIGVFQLLIGVLLFFNELESWSTE